MKKKSYSISIKGRIFLALGGYSGEHHGEKSKEKTERVMRVLKDILNPDDGNRFALIYEDNEFKLLPIKTKLKRRGFFKPLY